MREAMGSFRPGAEPPPIPLEARKKPPPTLKESVPAVLKETVKMGPAEKNKEKSKPAKTLVETPPIPPTPEVAQAIKEAKKAIEQAAGAEAIPTVQEIISEDLRGEEMDNALTKIASDKDAAIDFLINVNDLDPELAEKVYSNNDPESLTKLFKRQVDVKRPEILTAIKIKSEGKRRPAETVEMPSLRENMVADRLKINDMWKERGQYVSAISKKELDREYQKILEDSDTALDFVSRNTGKPVEQIKKELEGNSVNKLLKFLSGKDREKYSAELRKMVSDIITAGEQAVDQEMQRQHTEVEKRTAQTQAKSVRELKSGPVFSTYKYLNETYGISPQQALKEIGDEQFQNMMETLSEDEMKAKMDEIFGDKPGTRLAA